ncbi:hypothetical protein F183_A28260 [Bryobacterales bacterium F-183]|nr:hypothetical protein F183_A28260 [Bryobacterales bacterium F-183]
MVRFYLPVFLAAALCALSGCDTARGKDTPSSETAVRAVMDQFFTLSKVQDWDGVGALMSKDFEIYTDNAESYGKDAYVKLLKADNLSLTAMSLRDERVAVSGDGSMAWMTYKGHFETTVRGKPSVAETAETIVFRKEGGQWYLCRAHASVREVH